MKPSFVDAKESVARSSSRPRLIYLQRYGLVLLSVGVALGVALLLEHFHFHVPSVLLLLFAVAISSWYGGPGPSVLAAILSTISFYWYFVEPVRTIYIYRTEIPFFIIFAAFVALMSWFATIRRRVEADLREQADLLNLTHDTVFVTDMEGVIKYWNRGAEERYGWTAEQALGKVVHDLLKTVFPAPLEEIKAKVMRTSRWEGELLHTRKDGTLVTVASRWSVQRDERGTPVAILETNNDISERKRAEDALRRLNRELRAITNCNQVLLRAADEQSLLEEICRIVCEEAGYRLAFVTYAEHDEAKSVRPVAWTGAEDGYLATVCITWADAERGRGPTGTAIRSGRSCCIQDFATDPRFVPWRESALQHGFRSGIALPLKDEQARPFGCLTIHSAQPNAFTPEEVRLLEELAADLAFGIVTLRSRAARKLAEQEVALLSFAMDNVRDVALLIDETARFHYVNEEACRILGYTRAELLGMSVPDVDPDFPQERWSDHWRDLQAQRSLSFESHHRTRDGRIYPVEISANYFEYGGRAYNLALARDITERKLAEEAVRRSEAYLAEAQKLTHTGSWASDGKTRELKYWSEEMFRIFAIDPKKGLPTKDLAWQRIHPEDHAKVKEASDRTFREKIDYDVEYRIVLPSGTVKHIHSLGHPVLNADGEIVEVVGTNVDITERKRAEEALQKSEAYLAEGQRLGHAGSWSLSPATGQTLYWSEEMFRIFGFNPKDGLPTGEKFWQRIHPEDRGRVYQLATAAKLGKMEYEHEHRIMLPDGSVKHIHAIGHPVFDENGQVSEYVGTTIDVTERKRAEEALRRSEAYLAEAQRLTQTCTWVSDGKTREVLYWSEEAFRMYDVDPTKGMLTRDQAWQRIHPEDRAKVKEASDTTFREKVDYEVEYRIVLPDGTVKHILSLGHPVLNANGEIVEVVGTNADITERKLAEHEREALRADLAHVNRVSMLGELAASIAHEVNQPLSGIVSNAGACLRFLAGDSPNLEEVREAARDIVRDGRRAGEVVARIRALTRRAAAPREKLDLNETIREVLALVGDEARKKSVIIRMQFADDLSTVAGDRVQLQQVVLNLVMNAIEAMSGIDRRPRELVITTRNVDRDQVQATVEDSGIGLDPHILDKIFDSFYTTKPEGMGMGLSICRSILQAHGGRLWAVRKDGAGTVFHFTVPKYHDEASNGRVAAA